MPSPDFSMAASFLSDHGNELTAIATVVLAFVVARLADRGIAKRMAKVDQLSPVAITRLRLVRRLIFALIILIGLALALAQFPSVKRLATGVLASTAVLGLVFGFAARQTLANAIAGIMLAISQPIRVGDLVTFEEETGEVEDMLLTYTYIRLDDGTRLIVPNERLAQSSVHNHTILDPRVQVEVSVWLQPDVDLDKALELVPTAEQEVESSVAEVDKEGVRLSANTWVESPAQRGVAAATLRREWLRRLREHGLSSNEAT